MNYDTVICQEKDLNWYPTIYYYMYSEATDIDELVGLNTFALFDRIEDSSK